MRRRPKIATLVIVSWVDIHAGNEWSDRTDDGLALCQSVGFVSGLMGDRISLVATRGQDEDKTARETLQRITIPWGCVRGWRYLE